MPLFALLAEIGDCARVERKRPGMRSGEIDDMAQTLFQKYGGFAALSKLVLAFYDRLLDSPRLAPYFADTDMRTLVDHQTKFVASLMGGPASFSDDVLRRSHRNLKINKEAFEEMLRVFEETLQDFDIEEHDVARIIQQMRSREHLIVTV